MALEESILKNKRCRREISAKRKGKLTKIGNKSKIRYTFIKSKSAVPVYIKVDIESADLNVSFHPDSYFIGVDNHASR